MSRKKTILFLVIILLQVILITILSTICFLSSRVLSNYDDWISTKMTLSKAVMGAEQYVSDLQALAKGRLNLGAWHGYQELIFKRKLELDSVEFDFTLRRESYLVFIFNKDEDGFMGVRLSASPRHQSMIFRASDVGQFQEKTPIANLKLNEGREHHFTIKFGSRGASIFLDKKKIGMAEENILEKQVIGFRGGLQPAFVYNILIKQKPGISLYYSFSYSKNKPKTIIVLTIIVLLLNGLFVFIYRLKNSTRSIRNTEFSLITFNLILIFAGTIILGWQYYHAQYYQVVDKNMRKKEAYWKNTGAQYLSEQIRRNYAKKKQSGAYRILFMGSSQTWGAGAAKEDETFVAQVEKMLNSNEELNIEFECINGGISALNSMEVLKYYKTEWIKLKPEIVVINLSSNDDILDEFELNIKEMINIGKQEGVKTFLITEPNSRERENEFLLQKHGVVKKLGKLYNESVIEMNEYLIKNDDKGFLWWDFVHLTSFGQKLFANKVYEEIISYLETNKAGTKRR